MPVSPTVCTNGYDSDGPSCPCTYHPVMMSERVDNLLNVSAWPGPICGACWASSCACGFVFEDVGHAHSRRHNGRLVCHGCA